MTKPASALTIRLFGAPEIKANGNPLGLNNQKARALLFYLAATGQAHTRNEIALLLWSESTASKARGSLRTSLFQLRRCLKAAGLGERITAQGDLLRLEFTESECDLTQFYCLVGKDTEAALGRAVALVRGPLLSGFDLPNTPLFDEWHKQEQEKFTQIYLSALKRLAEEAEANQNRDETLRYLRTLVRADPLLETSQQRLIAFYIRIGDISQGLRQYQQFDGELRQKLGLEPSPETQALFREGLRLQRAGSTEGSAQQPGSDWAARTGLPFVGRDDLLERLQAISQDARSGRGSTVLLQGDGGIGKTRLLKEFLFKLASETPGWLVLQGTCSPFDDLISYGPFLEAFQETPLGDLTDRLMLPASEAPAARDQFAHRILQTLRKLGRNASLVLAIDDLQWANSPTLNLFGLLATRLHRLPMMLIGTVQRPETIPALQRLVTVERRRGQLQLLPLTPLTESSTAELLHRLSVNLTSIPSLAKWLQERSDGNPFVLNEMVAQLRVDAVLNQVGEQWHLDRGRWLRWKAAYTLPETTHDLVSWRLRKLPAEALSVLELLAVAGQPLPSTILMAFPGVSAGSLPSTLDTLLSGHLLVEIGDKAYALTHHLLRETILHRLSHVRRRMIHRQLANMLANLPENEVDFPRWEIARHAVAGEDIELAHQYGLQILSQLPQDYTGAGTLDFLHHLHDLLKPSLSLEEMVRLTRVIGSVHQSLGHLAEASHWRRRYLELTNDTGDAAAQATAHFEIGELSLISNDYLAATRAAEAGLKACASLSQAHPDRERLSARGHRLLGHALAMDGSDLLAADRHLQEATTAHRMGDNPRDLCASLFELGNVAAQRGDLLRALDFYAEARQVAKSGHVHYFHALAHNNIAYHSLLLGRLNDARSELTSGQQLAEIHELLGALLHLTNTQGEIYLYLAEWDEAAQTFQRGLALAEELGNPERQAGYRAGLALAARGQKEFSRALTLMEEALQLISDHGYWHMRTRLQIWLAESYLAVRRLADARPHLDRALETTRLHGRDLLHLEAKRVLGSCLAADGDWAKADICFRQSFDQARALGIPLEAARTQAAWGEAELRYSSASPQGHERLAQARQVFIDHHSAADLVALETTKKVRQ